MFQKSTQKSGLFSSSFLCFFPGNEPNWARWQLAVGKKACRRLNMEKSRQPPAQIPKPNFKSNFPAEKSSSFPLPYAFFFFAPNFPLLSAPLSHSSFFLHKKRKKTEQIIPRFFRRDSPNQSFSPAKGHKKPNAS